MYMPVDSDIFASEQGCCVTNKLKSGECPTTNQPCCSMEDFACRKLFKVNLKKQ